MEDANLNPPEHPRLPREAEQLQDPNRSPTPHEAYMLQVFLRYKEVPDFATLPAPTGQQISEARQRLDELASMPPDPLRDQDDRVLEMLRLISDFPALFGNVGYFLAAEVMNAAKKNIQESEFRRAFFTQYREAMGGIRDYLRNVAGLRRRARGAKFSNSNVPPTQWGAPERRAAAQEQMELVQNMPDYYVMEKYWRAMEILCSYPDFFNKDQYDQLASRTGIEQAWRAHLAKARQDFTYYQSIIQTAALFRKMIDSGVDVLRTIIREQEKTLGESGENVSES